MVATPHSAVAASPSQSAAQLGAKSSSSMATESTDIVQSSQGDHDGGGGLSNGKKPAAVNEKLLAAVAANRERELFVRRLIEFHRHRNVNTPIVSWPSLNGKPLDLHKLYTKVATLGGWERVCEKEKWDEVGMDLEPKTFETCTNGSHALKMIYVRYLGLYEKVHAALPPPATGAGTLSVASLLDSIPASSLVALSSATPGALGLNGASPLIGGAGTGLSQGLGSFKSVGSGSNLSFMEDKDDETSLLQGRRRFSYLLDAMPSTYNHHQHRAHAAASTLTYQTPGGGLSLLNPPSLSSSSVPSTSFASSPYEKLEISLSSGLANEIDFAFNTILLLSSDESHAFRLYNSPRLLDLMLAHIGFFGDGDKYEYRRLYDKAWHNKESESGDNKECVEQRIKELARLVDTESAYYDEYVRNLKRPPRRNFVKFWHEAVKLPDELYDVESAANSDQEDAEWEDDDEAISSSAAATAAKVRQSKGFASEKRAILELLPKMANKYLETLPEDDLLNLKLPGELASNAAELRRIEQVMVTLSNLSFEDNNAEFMANKSANLFEFLIMCLYCSNTPAHNEIRKHALDILANVSRKMKLKLLSDKHKRLLLVSIRHLIYGNSYNSSAEQHAATTGAEEKSSDDSGGQTATSTNAGGVDAPHDRLNILRGLEILTKLCSQHVDSYTNNESSNEKILAKYKLTTLFGSKIVPAATVVSKSGLAKYCSDEEENEDENNNNNSEDEEVASNGVKMVPANIKARSKAPLYMEKILARIENLLSIQDILILINSLECLYQMTQHNEAICNMIINIDSPPPSALCPSPSTSSPQNLCKFVSLLVNFLTVDMSHFGIGTNSAGQRMISHQGPMKMYKVMCNSTAGPSTSATASAASNVHMISQNQQLQLQQQQQQLQQQQLYQQQQLIQQQQQQQQQQQSYVKANSSSHPTLLQQTLNNQQLAANKALYTSTSGAAVKPSTGANPAPLSSQQEQQQAKSILCNWLRLCFQADASSALSKAELYPYYQQISKMNAWPAVPVIAFYDTLAATFPQLRYDNENNKINGLKLALNVKQQMALRHQIVANTYPQQQPAPAVATVAMATPTPAAAVVVATPVPAVTAVLPSQIPPPPPPPPSTEQTTQTQVTVTAAVQAETVVVPVNDIPKEAASSSTTENAPTENHVDAQEPNHVAEAAQQPMDTAPAPTETLKEETQPVVSSQPTTKTSKQDQNMNMEVMSPSVENDENHAANSQLTNDVNTVVKMMPSRIDHKSLNGVINGVGGGKDKANNVAEQLIKEIDQNLSQTTTTLTGVKKDLLAANQRLCNGHYNNHTNNNHSETENENENEICSKNNNNNNNNTGSNVVAKDQEVKVNGSAHTPGQQVPLTNGYLNSHSENPSSSSSSSLSEADIDMEPIDEKLAASSDSKVDEKVSSSSSSDEHKPASACGQDLNSHKRKSDEADIGKRNENAETSPSKQVVPEDSTSTGQDQESNKKQRVSDEKKSVDQVQQTKHTQDSEPKSEASGQQVSSETRADLPEPTAVCKENEDQNPATATPGVVVATNGPALTPQAPAAATVVKPNVDLLVNGDGGDYLCEWNNCKRGFSTAKAVYNHVCKYHLLGPTGCVATQEQQHSSSSSSGSNESDAASTSENTSGMLCLWLGCDQVRRQKWSLVNHIQERHCSENALKSALLCRQRGMIPIMNHPQIPNNSLNYSKDAALYAIQRHQRLKPEDFQLTPEEGPITKSLRLLAALTLRNLATNSKKAKSILKSHEPILTSIAFDLFESSTAVANCLWQISRQDETSATTATAIASQGSSAASS